MRKRVALSRGKDSRTTLPPVCGTFHSHSLLRSLPMPTTCRARTEKCSSLRSSRSIYRPNPKPRCRCAAPLRLRPSRSIGARKCNTCGSRLAMDGVCPSAYAFSVASRGSACFAALTPDCGHYKSQCSTSCRATPMAHLHTLLRLNRLLPCLRFTAHRHRLITNHVQGECRVKLA